MEHIGKYLNTFHVALQTDLHNLASNKLIEMQM